MTEIQPQGGLSHVAPYVPGKPSDELKRERGLEDVIKLASNENPLGPSPKAMAAVAAALPGVNLYPDGSSYYLRHALASHLDLSPDWITVGNGADGVILETCMAYLDESCEVITSRSSFPIYDIYTHIMRATLIKTPITSGYRFDLDAMSAAITPRTRLVFLCNPNNPTGTVVGQAEVDAFLESVPASVLVVIDEAYVHFTDAPDFPDSLGYLRQGRRNVLVMRTFSKAYGLAGLRLGYGLGCPALLGPINCVKEPFAVNTLAQVAGLAALEDSAFLERTISTNAAGRTYFYEQFERLGLAYVRSHTNFILLKVGTRAGEIQQRLLERGIIVRPCGGYDLPDFLRITVGNPSQNARLVQALEEILACHADSAANSSPGVSS